MDGEEWNKFRDGMVNGLLVGIWIGLLMALAVMVLGYFFRGI